MGALLFAGLGPASPMRMRGIYEGGFDALRISLNLYNSAAEVLRVLEVGASAQKAKESKSIATQSPRKAPVSAHKR